MAIKVGQAFERTSAQPIDVTLTLTKADMLTINDNLMPAYYFTICQDDGKIYLYDKTATPDPATGKFSKFSGGGGGGSSDVKFFTTTDNLSKTINGTKVVAAADLPGVTWSDLVVGSSVIKDAKGTMGLVTAITGTTSVTVTTATTSAHTIVDTDGSPVADEPKLQFTGLDVSDNSTDGETEVESFGLNADSLDDVVSGNISTSVVQPFMNYSTNETVVGKWVDGKPVYQKTVACGTLPNNTSKRVSHNISNIDYIINWTGSASDSTGIHIKFPYVNIDTLGNSCNVWIDKTAIGIEAAADFRHYTKSYVTLQYTKTTD